MKLKDYRKAQALSRAKAAEQLKVHQIQVWRWETGRSVPTPENILAIGRWSRGAVTAEELLAPAKKGRVQ